ncbi:MAG: glycoside hydrolase family 3 N-terminal domain-containing protein [Polaribacter sp.]|uniref:glycoside hydrolase family 3 protein n=1 Tax=Polaribacter sp. TaxID=1920175 RepID=UPI00260B6566|nr:glycoside hydrolase family 3 N-terminal domain-containing protein [Polaribacter sp.]MDG1194004.1 glycoside hydrolase family 3 N-terminal domain-containing protein [Polaribacter sp.]MDG1403470.1 glycoside hydrolase family 3 N-terminal domain-containing protein [Polaribacter sp.]
MKVSSKAQIEQKVEALLELMTLEEKIGQMSQIRHFEESVDKHVTEKFIGSIIHTQGPNPGKTALGWQKRFIKLQKKALSTRLGIPLLFAVDAVHGQNTFEGATIFPHNVGLGATGNENLVQEIAEITALESQATGFNWVFSPCVAIPFNEKWGRVYEAFSESTELTEKLTRASVKGHQGNLADPKTVMATAKHFVGDGATDFGVEGGNTSLSRAGIKERLLAPYRMAVKENVGAVMASFNTVSGISMHAHKSLITDVLKVDMNFDGIVVSDWKGYSRFGKNDIINAGIDMIMAVDGDLEDFQKGVKRGVETDTIAMSRIDDAVKRILRQKFRLGLFENPFPDSTLVSKIGIKKHRNVARQAVRESIVLLKNKNKVLPLDKETKKIVVVGEHANSSGLQSGGWTVNWQGTKENYKGATTILEGIKKHAKGNVVYDKEATQNHFDADIAIIVVGETPYAEFFGDIGHESNTRKLTLTEEHQNYIKTYSEKGIKTIVVLVSGRPLVVTDQIETSDAFMATWLIGSEGDGVAEIIFGDFNFSGKLPHSWPKSEEDYKGKYGPNFWDKTIQPLYPLGYGLKY